LGVIFSVKVGVRKESGHGWYSVTHRRSAFEGVAILSIYRLRNCNILYWRGKYYLSFMCTFI